MMPSSCLNFFLICSLYFSLEVIEAFHVPRLYGKTPAAGFLFSSTSTDDVSPDELKAQESQVLLESKEISRLKIRIEELNRFISETVESRCAEETELAKLDQEFSSEIQRIKKEFARIKERSYEEAQEVSDKAKVDALKEVLPITDNYFRAKQAFEPLETDNEKALFSLYDKIFADVTKVLHDFGLTRIESVGQAFDFNFMEAIMTAPSTEYGPDVVCTEYQIGYKMGNKCVRPAMVVVSTGPGQN